jgi:hypothetical protein
MTNEKYFGSQEEPQDNSSEQRESRFYDVSYVPADSKIEVVTDIPKIDDKRKSTSLKKRMTRALELGLENRIN